MITDEQAEAAVDFLRDTAAEVATRRATMIYNDEYRKTLKAILMKENTDLPVSAQEREAYAHARYIQHLSELRDGVFEYERLRATREAAVIKIETWRSQQANARGKL